jgi:translation initiation factor IF-1
VHDFKVGDLVIEIPARARRHARKPLVGVVTELIGGIVLKVQFSGGHEELAAITTVDKLSNSRGS